MDIKITADDWSLKHYVNGSVYEFEYVTDTINLVANVNKNHLYIYLNDVELFVKKKLRNTFSYFEDGEFVPDYKDALNWASKQVSKFFKINGAYRSEDAYYNFIECGGNRKQGYCVVYYNKEVLIFKVSNNVTNIEFLVEAEDGIELYRKVITKKSILSTCNTTDDYYNYLVRKYLTKIGQEPNNFIRDYDYKRRKEIVYKSLEYYDNEYA